MASFAQKRLTKQITNKFKKMEIHDLVVWSLLAEEEVIKRVGEEELERIKNSLTN